MKVDGHMVRRAYKAWEDTLVGTIHKECTPEKRKQRLIIVRVMLEAALKA